MYQNDPNKVLTGEVRLSYAKPVLDFIRPRCKIIPFPGCPAGQAVTQ